MGRPASTGRRFGISRPRSRRERVPTARPRQHHDCDVVHRRTTEIRKESGHMNVFNVQVSQNPNLARAGGSGARRRSISASRPADAAAGGSAGGSWPRADRGYLRLDGGDKCTAPSLPWSARSACSATTACSASSRAAIRQRWSCPCRWQHPRARPPHVWRSAGSRWRRNGDVEMADRRRPRVSKSAGGDPPRVAADRWQERERVGCEARRCGEPVRRPVPV